MPLDDLLRLQLPGLPPLLRHLQEQQVRQLLGVLNRRNPVITQRVAVRPQLVDQPSRVRHQRAYAALRGEQVPEVNDPGLDGFIPDAPVEVTYCPQLPPEAFDIIIVHEAHPSIYGAGGVCGTGDDDSRHTTHTWRACRTPFLRFQRVAVCAMDHRLERPSMAQLTRNYHAVPRFQCSLRSRSRSMARRVQLVFSEGRFIGLADSASICSQ
jgi:hypothetical protein